MSYMKRKSPIDHLLASIDDRMDSFLQDIRNNDLSCGDVFDASLSPSQIETFLSSENSFVRAAAARRAFHSGISLSPETVREGLSDNDEFVVLSFLPLANMFFEHVPEGFFKRKMHDMDKRRVVRNLVSRGTKHPSVRHAAIEHPDIPLSEKDINYIVFGPYNFAEVFLEPANIRVAIVHRENIDFNESQIKRMIDKFEKDVIIALCERKNLKDPQKVICDIREKTSQFNPLRPTTSQDMREITSAVEIRQALIDREKLVSTARLQSAKPSRKTTGAL